MGLVGEFVEGGAGFEAVSILAGVGAVPGRFATVFTVFAGVDPAAAAVPRYGMELVGVVGFELAPFEAPAGLAAPFVRRPIAGTSFL